MLRKLTPDQRKIARSREEDPRPAPSDEAIEPDMAIQAEEEEQREVTSRSTQPKAGRS